MYELFVATCTLLFILLGGFAFWQAQELRVLRLRVEGLLAAEVAQREKFAHIVASMSREHEAALRNAVEAARIDTAQRSRATIRGQATEHLAPMLMSGFNPKDFRWIGMPVDFLVCHGLSDVIDGVGDSIVVYLVDIKTSGSQLTKAQRRIRDAVVEGRVIFGVFNPDTKEFREYPCANATDIGSPGVPVQAVPPARQAAGGPHGNGQVGVLPGVSHVEHPHGG